MKAVVDGATMKCSMGTELAKLSVLPTNQAGKGQKHLATILDHQGMINIPPFGMCSSMANPIVQLATMAAGGALAPQPCLPITEVPWTPGVISVVLGGAGNLFLTSDSKCMCTYAGVIEIVDSGAPDILVGPRANTVSGPANLWDSVTPPPPGKPGLADKIGKVVGSGGSGTPDNPSTQDVRGAEQTDADRAAARGGKPPDTTKTGGVPFKF